MYKSRRKVLCYVKIPCQWRIFQISRVSIPNQWESNILYSLQSSFCYYPSFGKTTFENTKKLQKNGRRLRKNFITNGVFQIDMVVLMENLSNQRTLGLITETIKGVTVFSWWEWLGQNMSSFLPMGEWMVDILTVAIGPKVPENLPLSLDHLRHSLAAQNQYHMYLHKRRCFSPLFIHDETLPSEGFNHRKTCV